MPISGGFGKGGVHYRTTFRAREFNLVAYAIITFPLAMLAKKIAKNQLTLPKAVTDAVRAKLAELRLTERDVADAVTWARRPGRKPKK